MNNDFRTPAVCHLKLSELNQIVVRGKKLVKITGNVDLNNKHVLMLNHKKEIVLYSEEPKGRAADNTFLISNGFEFEDSAENTQKEDSLETWRYQVLVDFSFLDDFNVLEINPAHDLVQFVGYKASSSTNELTRFDAISFRVIKRTTLAKYYAALDVQNSFVSIRI
jgi:phage anti-repressor protein